MSTPVTVSTLQSKAHDRPDELRTPDKSRIEVVHFEAHTIGRLTLEPGWRWSECIKPVTQTDSCELSHVGYVVSGRLAVKMHDGRTLAINPGESYTIPPGHDAWVEGDQPCVAIEILSADVMAKP